MDNPNAFAACTREFSTLVDMANVTLWAAIVAAIIITALTIVERLASLWKRRTSPSEAGGSVVEGSFLDSLKGVIGALAAAPAWFAILVAGVLLLWCAGKFTPAECNRVQSSAAAAHTTSGSEMKESGEKQK
jgi:hypothetical protein